VKLSPQTFPPADASDVCVMVCPITDDKVSTTYLKEMFVHACEKSFGLARTHVKNYRFLQDQHVFLGNLKVV
jgi:hypothetical protein